MRRNGAVTAKEKNTVYDKANYFAILPAAVRYDRRLSARAVLLYGLIRSLSVGCGEAFASNKYLADALNISERTVGRLLAELEADKYIAIRYEYVEGTKEIAKRYIRRCELPSLLLDLPPTADDAVIPTRILLMPELSVQAKLLYVEISAATPTDGYCSKPATFFAKLLHTSETTIQRYTRELIACDALRVEMEYKGDTREIRRRRIYLTEAAAIAEKRADLASDVSKDVAPNREPNESIAANTPEKRRILGGVIFDTTYKNDKIDEKPAIQTRKQRKPKRGKRRKNTDRLRL